MNEVPADVSWTRSFLAPNVVLHRLKASEDGPKLLIQAGIHGDEIAGVHALQELLERGFAPRRGELLLVPVMNPGGYRARERRAAEGHAGYGGHDLNRAFPGDAESDVWEPRLAHRFMKLVDDERPALVATLHESQKRYDPEVQPSFGQTLVYGVDPAPPVVSEVVARMNETKRSDSETWASQYYPVATSSTEVIVEAFGCVGVCVETWMGFDERRRIEMQQEVVCHFLEAFGLGFQDNALTL